jgi:glycosyltransferase involved in cell wall biosynthesis
MIIYPREEMKIQGKPKKILFVISSLVSGGAEKVLSQILERLNRKDFEPNLAVFEKKGVYMSQLPPDVKLYDLKKQRRIDFFNLIVKLAYIMHREKPDVIVSFLTYTNIVSILAKKISFSNSRLIISEHSLTSISLKSARSAKVKASLVKLLFNLADKIIVVCKRLKQDMVINFKIHEGLIDVIYNGLDIERVKELSKEPLRHNWFNNETPCIVAVGRLVKLKGFPVLLKAFSLVRKQSPIKLVILGEGEERDSLEKISRNLKIENDVALLGFKKNPYKYLSRSDIFVLSSFWEGFPNVVIEAMGCGVPVIATRCPSGLEEIITDGVNGLLVPVGDVNALAEAMLKLLKDEPLRKRLGEAGRKRVGDFSLDKLVAEYERLFKQTASAS